MDVLDGYDVEEGKLAPLGSFDYYVDIVSDNEQGLTAGWAAGAGGMEGRQHVTTNQLSLNQNPSFCKSFHRCSRNTNLSDSGYRIMAFLGLRKWPTPVSFPYFSTSCHRQLIVRFYALCGHS